MEKVGRGGKPDAREELAERQAVSIRLKQLYSIYVDEILNLEKELIFAHLINSVYGEYIPLTIN